MNSLSIKETLSNLPSPSIRRLEAPLLNSKDNQTKVVLGVASMIDHMTDEGYQITHGLSKNGYSHCGHSLPIPMTDVKAICEKFNPNTLVMQDIREWDVISGDFRDREARFTNVESLLSHPEIFRLTILKDCHQRPSYHRQAAEAMGCHAWIIYYHPEIVHHLAPYIRPQHCIRTYHSIDTRAVPPFHVNQRTGTLLSGALSGAYPLRKRISQSTALPIQILPHPGYHRSGCNTPKFFKTISQFKVHICTASRYGYTLRKIIESAAAGCRVITDLPFDEVLPEIDENLIRISPDISMPDLKEVILETESSYNESQQEEISKKAIKFYDYLEVTRRLSDDIEELRKKYNG